MGSVARRRKMLVMRSADRLKAIVATSLLWPTVALAAERGPVGLSCRAPSVGVRNGSFALDSNEVRLKNGKGCFRVESESGCDYGVEVRRIEQWGPRRRFLLVSLDADHLTGSGSWTSIF